MSSGLPLRDRLQSNSPDPPPPGSPWLGRPTTPLRIAKRDSPQGAHLSRRQSSSYKHLRTNNLVSKSPFRSQLPTPAKLTPSRPTPARQSAGLSPSPRKVSGEKRPRPHSMVATENEHPLGFKRRQSRAFQGLLEKEPVTKSPFRVVPPEIDSDDALPPPLPPKLTRIPVASASPGRSSLVSKRLHGPRTVGNGSFSRRQRRKTVTFDEHCDVLEFHVEEHEIGEDVISTDEESGDDEEGVLQPIEPHLLPDAPSPTNESFDSSHAANDSITGLVETLLQDTDDPHTPPRRESSLPPDTDTEDGIPFGRTHHSERLNAAHQSDPIHDAYPGPEPLGMSTSTPPRSRSTSPIIDVGSPSRSFSGTPERPSASELDEDVRMLPPSPSPAKRPSKAFGVPGEHVLVPRFSLEQVKLGGTTSFVEDPFSVPHIKEESVPPEISFASGGSDDCMDPANLSIGHSEVSLEGLDREQTSREEDATDDEELLPPQPPFFAMKQDDGVVSSRTSTPLERSDSHASTAQDFNFTSPITLMRSSSPRREIHMPKAIRPGDSLTPEKIMSSPRASPRASSANGSNTSRPASRSWSMDLETTSGHPLREQTPGEVEDVVPQREEATNGIVPEDDMSMDEDRRSNASTVSDHSVREPPPLSREKNYTYDGVMSLDPNPQPIDPPRPNVLIRAQSDVEDRSVFQGIQMDFDHSTFGLGQDDMFGRAGSASSRGNVHLGDVSALDRLMENVAQGLPGDTGAELQAMQETEDGQADDAAMASPVHANDREQRAAASAPKEAIRAREDLIKAKKREAKRKDELASLGHSTPSAVQARRAGRPSRRRSMSTGDAEDLLTRTPAAQRRAAALRCEGLLDDLNMAQEDDPLADSINRELRKLEDPTKSKYHIRQHQETIYASSDAEQISHVGNAGDVNGGKAWRIVKRPSDMNEYARQLKELRAQDKSGKAHGKVFVRVTGLKGVQVPLPREPTIITCTLNNGIHFVTTPECRLGKDCRIEQEFELIEHSKLEFTLTIKVRRDPHVVAQFKANTPPPPPAPSVAARPVPPPSKGGMLNFFRSSSPKKPARPMSAPAVPVPEFKLVNNLARYLKPDGTLARAFISFRDIAHRCDATRFEVAYPLIGQRLESRTSTRTFQVGEIMLQIFRLPPLPGIPSEQLPQSLDECHKGLRHCNWHKQTYFEGTLTQSGGDCMSWRRRHLRLVGANLVAYNDVTKKVTATIDLRKAVSVEDDDVAKNALSPQSGVSNRSRHVDELDIPYGVERSFRLVFLHDQEITFFADTEEEKSRWVETLRALVGRVPQNPLWAEMLWQRQEAGKHTQGHGVLALHH
ncbi:uncharacterized protein B0H18DRAFT_1123545 [Fomitopsis serialis]|uniref:uncharacterized protein n=1 Tax=Fomitopsis serialis TaxID=139415 RepID=UPI002007AB9D|nr:uncharacterized protein B0H18DRAFT_1123545 [Neoantrodia serialis]KAH9917565.1 hypothetical protein B0H18DRAFT_1123545 [Neoantrodia serialis]